MKKCGHCGASNSINSSYCYLCTRTFDRRVEQAAARWQAVKGCRFCGTPNLKEATRCYQCGDPLHAGEHEELRPVPVTAENRPVEEWSTSGDPEDWREALRAMRDQQPQAGDAEPREKIVVQPWWKTNPQRA